MIDFITRIVAGYIDSKTIWKDSTHVRAKMRQ
jgi:hypothetical protein